MHEVKNHYYHIHYEYELPGDDEFMHTRLGFFKCMASTPENAADLLRETAGRKIIHRMEIISHNFQGEEDAPRKNI